MAEIRPVIYGSRSEQRRRRRRRENGKQRHRKNHPHIDKKKKKKKNRTRCLTLCKGEGPYDEVAEISIRRAHVTPSYSDQRLSEAACERISPGVQIERLEASGSLQRASISQEATAKCFGQSNKWQRDTDAP